MTQPDRRHLRRARLALAVVVAAAPGRLAVVPWRAYLSAAESDGVSLPGSSAGQRVYRRLGAAGRAGLICADDPPGDRRSAAGFPDYLANAALFGAFWGGALSWFSAMVGAGLCFCIARALGREVVEKLTGRAVLRSADGYFTRFGPQTILVCRLLPFVPFDPVSYAAGLTSLRFWPFMLATGVGQLPATIVYSWAGSLLTGGTFWLATGLSLLFALAVVISIAKNIYRERHKRSSP